MSTQEEKDRAIREAAIALANALTAGGKDYNIFFHRIDVTTVGDSGLRYRYDAHITEVHERTIIDGRS